MANAKPVNKKTDEEAAKEEQNRILEAQRVKKAAVVTEDMEKAPVDGRMKLEDGTVRIDN